MSARDFWSLAEAAALPLSPAAELLAWGPVLVLAPHADDEALGCGGAIAVLRQAGVPVRIAWLTDGRHSHPHSQAYPAERLAAVREAEALASARALGVAPAECHFFRQRDAHPPEPGSAGERAALRWLEGLLEGVRTILVTWRGDPHCDHRAAARLAGLAAAARGLQAIEYPVWVWQLGRPGDLPPRAGFGLQRVDVSAGLAAKGEAIAAHRSQLGELIHDDPTGFTLPPALLEHFRQPWELFIYPL